MEHVAADQASVAPEATHAEAGRSAGPHGVHAPGCGCGGCGPRLTPSQVMALQRTAGNAAVARALAPRVESAVAVARSAQAAELGPAVLARVIDDTKYNAGREARDQWISQGKRGPIDHTPSTGRGGFSAEYDPGSQMLTIELRGGVEFKNGMDMWFGTFVVAQQPDNAPAKEAAKAINKLPRAQRRAAMAPWLWTPDAKTTFLNEFRSSIQDAWKGKHQLHCSKEFWTDLGSSVDVKVVVKEGKKEDTDHMKVVSYKESDQTVASTPAHVADTSTFSHDATDNEMVVTSTQTRRRQDIPQSVSFGFKPGTKNLTTGGVSQLHWFADAYKSGGGPRCSKCSKEIAEAATVRMTMTVPGEGADPQKLGTDRIAEAKKELVAGGMADADTRVMGAVVGTGTSGSARVGAGINQIVAAHEAGHMFGLGDEYTAPFSGTGGDLGTPVDGNLGPSQNLPGAVAENSDTIMSVGDAVKPQHYATFLEALKKVTAMPEWEFGPPVPVAAPAGAADPVRQPQPGEPKREPTAVA